MNKRHYEHTLPNIRGSLSNTYESNKIPHGSIRIKHLQIPFGKKKNPIRTKLKSLPNGNPNASEGNQSPIFPLIPKQKNGRKERLSN